jgi:hypothetical protein
MAEMDKTNETQKRVPDWVLIPYMDFLMREMHLVDYRALSFFAILSLVKNPGALDGLGERHKAVHQRTIDLAREEFAKGYPILQEQAVAALWELLESFVLSFLTNWLTNQPELTQLTAIRKIKIPLADYEKMSQDEKYDYLVDELERGLGAPFKQGSNRFEVLLDVFGLSGPVDEPVRKDLFELSQVRNVIVHRRGIVDRRLAEACPWMGLRPGDRLSLTVDDWERYLEAVDRYSSSIIYRAQAHFGVLTPEADLGAGTSTGDDSGHQ